MLHFDVSTVLYFERLLERHLPLNLGFAHKTAIAGWTVKVSRPLIRSIVFPIRLVISDSVPRAPLTRQFSCPSHCCEELSIILSDYDPLVHSVRQSKSDSKMG